eukprot:3643554-Pleurochrysis_carterae.AAC.1
MFVCLCVRACVSGREEPRRLSPARSDDPERLGQGAPRAARVAAARADGLDPERPQPAVGGPNARAWRAAHRAGAAGAGLHTGGRARVEDADDGQGRLVRLPDTQQVHRRAARLATYLLAQAGAHQRSQGEPGPRRHRCARERSVRETSAKKA